MESYLRFLGTVPVAFAAKHRSATGSATNETVTSLSSGDVGVAFGIPEADTVRFTQQRRYEYIRNPWTWFDLVLLAVRNSTTILPLALLIVTLAQLLWTGLLRWVPGLPDEANLLFGVLRSIRVFRLLGLSSGAMHLLVTLDFGLLTDRQNFVRWLPLL
jgi:hypothetical protein